MKYNTKRVSTTNGETFIFVTRGKSKPFSDKEVADYLEKARVEVFQNTIENLKNSSSSSSPANSWQGIPEDKQRKRMFLNDLKLGIDFCRHKYGASRSEILAEAARIAPFMNYGE